LVRLALASVVANIAIVITGGAVRLTGSGLGCPTWPSCSRDSLTPTAAFGIHGQIEFANRTLTFVLGVIAIATVVVAWRQRRERPLALAAFGGIPAQALLGGITVRTGLNPWIVSAHFLVSMAIIAMTLVLWWRLRGPIHSEANEGDSAQEGFVQGVATSRPALLIGRLVVGTTAAVLMMGTVVTGSGPHAGDDSTPRTGLAPASMSQLHADAVMLLIGLTVALVVLLQIGHGSTQARRAGWTLLWVEFGQGVIGYTQYYTHVPAALVAMHLLGACLVWVAALKLSLVLTANVNQASAVGPLQPAPADHSSPHSSEQPAR
jgi:cytochrome c oxidase assembly protein subunit 15